MGERSKVGPKAPSSSTEVKDTKSRMRSEVWLEALWGGQRPSPQSTKKGCPAKRALHRIRVQGSKRPATHHAPPGRGQIRHPRPVSRPFGGVGSGKTGPSLTCREGAPAWEGRGGARAVTQRPGYRLAMLPGAPTGTRAPGGRKGGAERDARSGSPRAATAGGGGAASSPGSRGERGSGLVERAHPLRLELRLRGRRRQQRRRQQRQHLLDGSSIFAAAPPAPLAAATNNNIRDVTAVT